MTWCRVALFVLVAVAVLGVGGEAEPLPAYGYDGSSVTHVDASGSEPVSPTPIPLGDASPASVAPARGGGLATSKTPLAAGFATETGASSVDSALSGLNAGRSAGVRVVRSTEDLDNLFGQLSRGGNPIESSYPGKLVELPDGTTVGLRGTSASGGPTIDIKLPTGEIQKVHVDPWSPTP